MTIHNSRTLRALIAAYDTAILFEESIPSVFRLARMFSEMNFFHGGLVLLGVSKEGEIIGIDTEEIEAAYRLFTALCRKFTPNVVEIGTLSISGKHIVFLVFNAIPRHLQPLDGFRDDVSHVVTV